MGPWPGHGGEDRASGLGSVAELPGPGTGGSDDNPASAGPLASRGRRGACREGRLFLGT